MIIRPTSVTVNQGGSALITEKDKELIYDGDIDTYGEVKYQVLAGTDWPGSFIEHVVNFPVQTVQATKWLWISYELEMLQGSAQQVTHLATVSIDRGAGAGWEIQASIDMTSTGITKTTGALSLPYNVTDISLISVRSRVEGSRQVPDSDDDISSVWLYEVWLVTEASPIVGYQHV